jgi:hypothetical protein
MYDKQKYAPIDFWMNPLPFPFEISPLRAHYFAPPCTLPRILPSLLVICHRLLSPFAIRAQMAP